MIAWFEKNVIIVLLVALGVSVVSGLAGVAWYKNKYEKADLAKQVAEANLKTAELANAQLSASVEHQNQAVASLSKATDDLRSMVSELQAIAAAQAKPYKDFAQALHNFQPPKGVDGDPCKAERAVVDAFFAKKAKP